MNKLKHLVTFLLLFVSLLASAQTVRVRGTIKDSSTGEPVPYALVNVKDIPARSMADANGVYTIRVSVDGVLVFSSLGYVDLEVAVAGREVLDVELTPAEIDDSEDIILPFHSESRTSFTGSAAVLGHSDIIKTQSPDVIRAVEGVVPGVRMTNSYTSPSVTIRGASSLYAVTQPLYVVDGVPFEGNVNSLNPSDIESVTVLKDAATNALYGVRGANGVIMIDTKKARGNGMNVGFDASWGVNAKAGAGYETIYDPATYYQAHYNALYNYYRLEKGLCQEEANFKAASNLTSSTAEGSLGYLSYTIPEGELLIGKNGRLNPMARKGRMVTYNGERYWLQPEDWMELSLKSSLRQEYNVNVSDSRGKLQTFGSFGYLNSGGIAENDGFRRYSARIKADYQPAETIRMGLNLSYANTRKLETDIFQYASVMAPVYPMYLRDSRRDIRYDADGNERYTLEGMKVNKTSAKANSFNGVGFFEMDFLEEFTFTINAGIGGNSSNQPAGDLFYFDFQEVVDWSHTFAGKHELSALIGHEWYRSRIDAGRPYNNNGLFFNAHYDYDGKIFATASFRSDASSHFSPGHRWGSFWSVSAGWLLSEESWFYSTWMDMLKVKASAGVLGNDGFGPAVAGYLEKNPGLTWENSNDITVGVDYGVFKGRMSGSLEIFSRKTGNMLCYVPRYSSDFYGNYGSMRNLGFEMSFEGIIMEEDDLIWDAYLNLAHYTNRVTTLHGSNRKVTVEGYEGYVSGNTFIAEGLPLNTFLTPQFAGVDQNDGSPLWVKDVLGGDGVAQEQTVTKKYEEATDFLCGDPDPALYGGFGTSLSFMDFDVSARFTYQIGGKCWDTGYMAYMASPTGSMGTNYHLDVFDAWTPENRESEIPRFVYNDKDAAARSDRFLVNASYLNFQNLQLGYTLPRRWSDRIMVNKLRVYLSCDNILFLSCRRGFDPRFNFAGESVFTGNYPVRTVSGGVSFTF